MSYFWAGLVITIQNARRQNSSGAHTVHFLAAPAQQAAKTYHLCSRKGKQ